MEIIIGREGSQKTPITDKTVSRKHCKVIVNPDGTCTIENLSDSGTKIEGVSIIRKTVSPDSRIQLGPAFTAKLSDLIGSTTKAATTSRTSSAPTQGSANSQHNEVPTFNISHLKRVWENHNQKNIEMADENRRINLVRTIFGVFTMCAMPMIFFFGEIGYILTGIGIIGNIYSFVGMKNTESPEERQKRQERFDDAWTCPNPKCGRSLPAKDYRYLRRNFDSCPYCKCKYVEK